jgi:hypothetical protein
MKENVNINGSVHKDMNIVKIKKILALADNNPMSEEGHTAMLLAQKMMLENNINMIDVNALDMENKVVIDVDVTSKRKTPYWHRNLARVISDNFRCHSYTAMQYQGSTIRFIGMEKDIEIAREVFEYALKVIINSVKTYVRLTKSSNGSESAAAIKNRFILGYLKGLDEKFKVQVSQNQWGLVLVKDPKVEQVYNKIKLKKGPAITVKMGYDDSHEMEGFKKGKEFVLIKGELMA